MDRWIPVFNIFVKSPCPEGEVSLWMQCQPSSPSPYTAFLAFLLHQIDFVDLNVSSTLSSESRRCIWFQTLPEVIQSRILSYLAVDYQKFCSRDLNLLVSNVLQALPSRGVNFWVKKSSRLLFDYICNSNRSFEIYDAWDGLEEGVDMFDALPEWLKESTTIDSLFPWLPLTLEEIKCTVSDSRRELSENKGDILKNDDESLTFANFEELAFDSCKKREIASSNNSSQEQNRVTPNEETCMKIAALRTQLLTFDSTCKTHDVLANIVREICLYHHVGVDPLSLFTLLSPWEADDNTISILLSYLSFRNEESIPSWSNLILCSTVLPKLLTLEEPASRVLVASTIEYCKLHKKEAVDSLLFPIILRMNGINIVQSDLLSRIVRECLCHAQVSAFCQKLLSEEVAERSFVCLSCHRNLISSHLVWTEPLCVLFQNILNHNVFLTPDSVDSLVSMLEQNVENFLKSLKFSNLLLCLLSKCNSQLKPHKNSLKRIADSTHTFLKRSILSKLDDL